MQVRFRPEFVFLVRDAVTDITDQSIIGKLGPCISSAMSLFCSPTSVVLMPLPAVSRRLATCTNWITVSPGRRFPAISHGYDLLRPVLPTVHVFATSARVGESREQGPSSFTCRQSREHHLDKSCSCCCCCYCCCMRPSFRPRKHRFVGLCLF